MGTGVAPGVRHNPVFGSPGEEFHPLPFNPPPPPPTHSPLEPGAPPGVPETRGSATQPSAARVWRKDRGKPCLKTRQGGGLGRDLPRKRVGRERTPVPGAGPQLRPGRGSTRGLLLPLGAGWNPSPPLCGPRSPPSDRDIVLWDDAGVECQGQDEGQGRGD